MDFDEYQLAASSTDLRPNRSDPTLPMLGLAGEVGSLVTEYKKRIRSGGSYSGFEQEVAEDLGDLLWYAATLASTFDLSLSEVARANLGKTSALWTDDLGDPHVYDAAYPEEERLPRQFTVLFTVESGKDGLPRVKIYRGTERLGDPIDDNTYEEDYYRFHDVFHLAHAAVLGWSPVFRWMLKAKRASNEQTDRVEDGGRAIALEEGLTAFTFSEAMTRGFFAAADQVDWDLIKTIRRMVSQLEVGDQPPNAWRSAILQGYSAWLQLRDAGGGIVEGDLNKRTLRVVPPDVA